MLKIILLILLLLSILISQKETFFNTSHWWNAEILKNKSGNGNCSISNNVIQKARNSGVKCKDNQYKEYSTDDLKNSCEGDLQNQNSQSPSGSNYNKIVDFSRKDETENTDEYASDKPILMTPMELPSYNMKTNYKMKKSTFTNGYQKDYENLNHFYKNQVCKKGDISNVAKKPFPTSVNKILDLKTNQMIPNPTTAQFTDKKKKFKTNNVAFHDLVGKVNHGIQTPTSWVVSRGYTNDSSYNTSITPPPLNNATPHNPLTPYICKECPISTIQTYEFNPHKIKGMTSLTKKEKDARKGFYFVEKGGTKKSEDKAKNKCDLCSYQTGCFSPEENRMDQFQTGSCANGKDRKCQKCAICEKGEKKVLTFCGEGGGTSDTKCAPCKICDDDSYKVDGCNIDNTIKDTVCMPKTDCLGQPGKDDKYKDPGPGKRTYVIDEGYSGSKEMKVKDRLGKEYDLPNPYYGKDRTCKICDECPENFVRLEGTCTGKNNDSNTICQRAYNTEKILNRDIKCQKGEFYSTEAIKTFIKTKNNELKTIDDGVRKTFMENNKKDPIKYDISKINTIYESLPDISDLDLQNAGCKRCNDCDDGFYTDPNDTGCVGRLDTKCIPYTKCKEDERIKIKGTKTSDVICGSCECPEGLVGTNPVCDGSYEVKNCANNIPCQDKNNSTSPSETPIIGTTGTGDEKLYTFDKPSAYGDSTRADRCKVCDKECPTGKFKIGGCDPNKSTNLVCKDHSVCDPKTQIVIEPGTTTSDTICKCIDGYEWDKDEFNLPDTLKPCVQIKGKCWNNPCHPNANCYDNFDDNGNFANFVCQCNHGDNWIETEDLGVGEKGCTKISDKHSHTVDSFDKDNLSAPQISDYGDLLESKPNLLNVMSHTHGIGGSDIRGKFHTNLMGSHIHK